VIEVSSFYGTQQSVSLHLRTETDPVSETSCFSSNYLESGRWTKSGNPVILCVIHHRQSPIESTNYRGFCCLLQYVQANTRAPSLLNASFQITANALTFKPKFITIVSTAQIQSAASYIHHTQTHLAVEWLQLLNRSREVQGSYLSLLFRCV
jgi:hypothetical protein